MSNNECQELKNIKYKTMLLSGNKTEIKPNVSNDISNIDAFLEKECLINKCEPWSKLDKTAKIHRLYEYAEKLSHEHKLNIQEFKLLKKYISLRLDKKQLQCVKDVNYDKEGGKIVSIPNLNFNKITRKFTLKRDHKRVSTLKSLAPKKSPSTKKNKKKN